MIHQNCTLNCRGRLLNLEEPIVMGILNVTPDSFFDGGRYIDERSILEQAEKMLIEGATIIDVGGMSSRPGAQWIEAGEEEKRVIPTISSILKHFPDALLAVDTFRASIARSAVLAGAAVVNDISAGRFDPAMYETVATLGVPYILMHMQNNPQTMQDNPSYENVTLEVLDFFIQEVGKLRALKIKDIIIDPGFGFGKTVDHNYQLLKNLRVFELLGVPLLAGLSRKSMICKVLKVNPSEALNGTIALHMIALENGAKILRVHDVKPAREVIKLHQQLRKIEQVN